MGYSQALSGLNAASQSLDVIGNNIANSQTVGFKGSSAQFADVYANSKVGLGTRVAGVLQNFNNGSLTTTGRGLDLAIAGNGFFRFEQDGQVVYSRNGQLVKTPEGYLENASGARLMGANGVIQIPTASMPAKATTKIESTVNLDAGDPVIAVAFNPADPDTYNFSTTANTFDSLGNLQTVNLSYVKTGTNTWQVYASLNGVVSPSGPQTLNFTNNGTLTGFTPAAFNFTMTNGAANMSMTFDANGTTQFGSEFYQSAMKQDGYTNGDLVGISVDKAGNIVGTYSNEQTQNLAQLNLATFANMNGLKPNGDNSWVETSESGQALVGLAGVGTFGAISANTLESSNVEMSNELVNLIIAQRNYQANSQTIKTQDEIQQTIMNLR
ncbi:flagellar hook protein FlgE [Pseudomonas aeruginosa]